MRGYRPIGIDKGDLEVVLVIALHRERPSHGQVDDRGGGLSGIDLAVEQQPCFRDRDLWR